MKDDLAKLIDHIDALRMNRRAFMGGTAAIGAAAAAAMGVAPAFAASHIKPTQGGTLKMGIGGGETTDSLDPGIAASSVPFMVNHQWGDTLVRVSPKGDIENILAESVSSSADGKTWTFNIRQGVKFHNGAALTAEDVAQTFRRHSDENSKSGALGIMKGLTKIAVDGNAVVLSLDTGNADLPYLLSDYHLMIQPNGGFDDPTAAIGTGPYKLSAAEPGVRYAFTKNPDDWNKDRGHYDAVEILVINDATARSSALQSGQVHAINRVEPKVAKLLDRAPTVHVKNVSGRGHYVFIMRTNVAPFDNNHLRLALKYAINRVEMVDKILDGYGGVGNDTPINAAYPLFDASLPQREFSTEKAAEHYKASGHDGSPIELIVADTAFPGAVDAAALFQQTAQAAGIPLTIKRVPNDGYWSDVWNVKPFCASYWGGRPVQDQMYSTAYLSTADWNDTAFNNPEFDALILKARGETDLVKRKAYYGQLAQILHDTGGAIVPMFNDFVEAISDKLQGWEANPNQELMDGGVSHVTWLA